MFYEWGKCLYLVRQEDEPRVPQTGPLYVLRVGFEQHPAESESRRTELILVSRLDSEVRRQLSDDPVASALARFLGDLACHLIILLSL